MNSRNTIFGLCLLLLGSLLSCQSKNDTTSDEFTALDHKQLPFDLSTFQRAYPDRTFDVKGFKAAFTEAVARQASRSTIAPEGFDEPWTVQGPGNAGARINTVEVDPSDDDVLYIGYSTGGVFKTTNDGLSWTPIFDDQTYLSIGAIEVDPNNSNTVYVGTGDPNITGYPFIGNGIYKSMDGGDSWQHLGLAETGIVSKIIVHPSNSQIIYAATMGNPFDYSDDRGLYKSIDGGASWTKVLFISDQAGVIDLAVHPTDPDVIYAAGWDRIRNYNTSIAYGNGGRIYRSENGGSSWEILDNGLPIKQLSRSSIAISNSDPDILYVSIVDSTFLLQGIYKTTNGGDAWTAVTEGNVDNGMTNPLSNFGWYFGRIFINPNNNNTIYLLGVRLWRSLSSGASWSVYPPSSGSGAPHVDNHYIDFNSQGDLYLGTDGGLYKNPAGTQSWLDREDIPTTQIYRVGYNPHEPNTYYGGTQDNGTQAGNEAGMDNWDKVFGADGFQPVFHPNNPDTFYFETQNGKIWRSNDGNGFTTYTNGINSNDRIHWDMQYIMSAHDPEVLYCGTHRVYRHDPNSSPTWYPISDDLTDGNIYGASFHTITTVHESPVDDQILYVGTTDGNVWRSTNYGTDWESISTGLPDRYVTSIKADPNNESGVYITHSGYRYGEEIPHVHYSSNNGTTWTNITGNLPNLGVNHIEVMPNNFGNVLFVATDGGVYATLDGGQSWDRLGTNQPFVPVYDLDLNIANNELVAGTFGRSICSFPLDSIGVSLNPPPSVSVTGIIKTVIDQGVDSVEVNLDYGNTITKLTNVSGQYSFPVVPSGSNAVVKPVKNNKHRNGLSTYDILVFKRHILKIDTLSPYQIIAGDTNNSGGLSTFDLVLLTKMVLMIDSVFEHNNSWRFVRSDYVFPDTLNPFPFPETMDYNPIIANQSNADFIGIKIGDANFSADPTMLMGEADNRDFDGTLELSIQDVIFRKGDQITIPVRAKDFEEMMGYQFTLEYDPRYLQFEGADKAALAETGSQDFGTRFREKGILTTNWHHVDPVTMPDGEVLFYLRLEAKADGQLSDLIHFNNAYTTKEAYQGLNTLLDIDWHWLPAVEVMTEDVFVQFELHQNSPNPVRKGGIANIAFTLPQESEVVLEMFHLSGEKVWSTSGFFPRGDHQIGVSTDAFSQEGIYMYRLRMADGTTATRRLLFIK